MQPGVGKEERTLGVEDTNMLIPVSQPPLSSAVYGHIAVIVQVGVEDKRMPRDNNESHQRNKHPLCMGTLYRRNKLGMDQICENLKESPHGVVSRHNKKKRTMSLRKCAMQTLESLSQAMNCPVLLTPWMHDLRRLFVW